MQEFPKIFGRFFRDMATRGFGKMLRGAREVRGWTQLELAERLETSTTTISNMEREETVPSVEQVNALVVALGLSPEELLRAMGVRLTPLAASKLPKELIQSLLALDPETLQGVTRLAAQAARATPQQQPRPIR